MTRDATFEEGGERPVRVRAFDTADLRVISSMVQDAVLPVTEMRYDRAARRFGLLLNRVRWEQQDTGAAPVERVQAVLAFEDVMKVALSGIDRTERDTILSLLEIRFEDTRDGGGRVVLTFAGDGAVALEVEALEATLRDVTRPYVAPSGKRPTHPD